MKSRIGNLVFIALGATLFYGGTSGCGSKTPTTTTQTPTPTAATPAMSSEQKLLGKWLEKESTGGPPHPPETWEFLAGGNLNLIKTENDKQLTATGTYKLEGSQMTVVLGNKLLLTFKFSFPADQLYLEELNDKGVVWGTTTLSRVTGPSATK
jgi:hypothetical protein